jgi:predicted ATPase/DNA-binding CsgD family transcriptional regulator
LVTESNERLVTLTGPPGVGKTRLALEGAARLAPDVVEGPAPADLTPIRDPDLVLPEIHAALGLHAASGNDPRALARALADRDVLLVLDNVEHVLPAAPVVSAVLAACPGLRIIATGRERLNLGAEHEFPVEPLAVPPDEPDAGGAPVGLTALSDVPAVALLVDCVRRFDPGFAVTPGNRAALGEVCRLLDGLPLALELAAARLRLFSPAELARLLRQRSIGLDGGAADAPARHRDLDTAIAWSHDLLSEVERVVFRRAAVFVGGTDLVAVHVVCGPDRDRDEIVDVLGSLIDKSLLRRRDRGEDTTEITMLESVRDHAATRLAAAGEDAAVRKRHAEHFARWAARVEQLIGTPREGHAVVELGRERGNLHAALDHARAADLGTAVAVPLGFAVGLYDFTRGRFGDGAAILDTLLATMRTAPPSALLAGAYVVAGATACSRGAIGHAETHLERGIAVADAVGARRWRAFATAFLGHVASARGRSDHAAAAYRRAGLLYAEADNPTGEAWTRYDLGLLARRRSDAAGAARHLLDALDSFRQTGYRWATACTAWALGSVEMRRGHIDEAAALFDEALTAVRHLDDRLGLVQCLEGAAAVAAARGRPSAAARLLGAAGARRTRLDAPLPAEDRADRATLNRGLAADLGQSAYDRERDAGRRSGTVVALAHEVLRANPAELALAALTAREREVARLVATGRTDRQIGRVLGIAERTVHVHVRHIIHKLDAGGRAGVAAQIVVGETEPAAE